ncbi:DUF1416 domain-containing protein [Sanguibacter suaedae]|uniref:DUF1416 domain-containing protein n=1 Tax=Sanguibacter suaedae TaxID=2795737 RepID=A0A934IAP8_9MICO|nr:DUF1416 domain-containing protein [Sanguibacter suaedae]MBI9115265.1 DUF1416 domain-containing protein [Sanguibacter suaedae]
MSCAAPDQSGPSLAAPGATVVEGAVLRAGAPVAGAYVRLHDASGEFTAEVVSGPEGTFRFYAAPGRWEVRVLAPGVTGGAPVTAEVGTTRVDVRLD